MNNQLITAVKVFAQHVSALNRTPLGEVVSMLIPDMIDGVKQYGLTFDQMSHLCNQATGVFGLADSENYNHITGRNYVIDLDESVVVMYQFDDCKDALITLFCDTQF